MSSGEGRRVNTCLAVMSRTFVTWMCEPLDVRGESSDVTFSVKENLVPLTEVS